jgi:hypothetical protein
MLDESGESVIETYLNGDVVALLDALQAFAPADALSRALRGDLPLPVVDGAAKSVFDSLSGDAGLQAMASQVDPKQAQKMFDRLSSGLMNRVGGDASAAQNVMNAAAPDWNSAGGRCIRGLLTTVNLPWQQPEFNALRDAYQLHARRRRSPNARLYPGDEAAMDAVANALDYVPVYGGR